MVLTPSNAFPNAAFKQHGSGNTTTVQNYIYPGAVQSNSTTPTVLTTSEALPAGAFLQHGSGLTTTVRSYIFPGAVQPAVPSGTSYTQNLTESVTNTDTKVSAPTRLLSETLSNTALALKTAARTLVESGASTSSGPNSPGTAANDASIGTQAWTNVNNVKTDDTTFAYALGSYLATIEWNSIRLIRGGTISGNDKGTGAAATLPSYTAFGGATDLWGLSLTAADINDSSFGVAVSTTTNNNAITNYVDATNFGFSIPSGATINGVVATVHIDGSLGTPHMLYISITVYYTNSLGITLSDVFTSSTASSLVKLLTETIANTDAFIRAGARTLSEALTNTDTLIRATAHSLTEAITNSDTLAHLATLSRTLAETLSNTATAVKTGARNLTDTITNTATTLKTSARTLPESVTNSDTLSKVTGYVSVLTETLTHADTFIRTTARNLIEAITNSDAFTSSKGSALAASLVSYWKLDEASGNAADSVGSNTLTNTGTVVYDAGLINNGADFGTANTTKVLSSTSASGVVDTNMSFSLWVKLNTEISTGVYGLFCARTNTSSHFIDWRIDYEYNAGTRRLNFVRSKPGVVDVDSYYTITLGTTNWYHLVLTYDTATMLGYVNATQQTTVSTSGYGTGGAMAVAIGASIPASNNPASVKIDEVGIWTRVLSSTEVTTLYNSGSGKQYPFGSIFTQALTEAITQTDALARAGIRTLAETLTNTATAIKAGGRTLLETITNTGTFASIKTTAKTLSDAVTSTDALIRAGARTLTETITNTASVIRSAARSFTETITNTASLTRTSVRALVETITNADVLSAVSGKAKSLTEAITNSDVLSRVVIAFRTFTETLTNSDIFASIGGLNVTLSEIIATTDSLIRAATKNFVETVTNTATLARDLTRGFTETLTNTASLIANKFVGSTFSETLSAADALIKTAGRVLLEALSNADSLIANKALSRTYTETITNTATALRGAAHALVETITQSDTFTRALTASRVLTETITNSDSVIKLVNGLVVMWSHVQKSADATWSQISKATDATWSKITKATTSWLHINKS